ncbi:hypothetical protein GOBAR_DD27714 [Gossypium barbadense]|nr:hypothetical protein GOBAR_DD27714 [Gossypium barbadense]
MSSGMARFSDRRRRVANTAVASTGMGLEEERGTAAWGRNGSNHNAAIIGGVSEQLTPSNSSISPPPDPESESNNDLSTEALAKALSSMLTSLIKDFDSKALDTLASQDILSSSIDRLTRELDQLLEDAPSPFIMQHAVKFSNVRKRVLSLNLLLKSIQRRVDNIDRMLSMGLQHGSILTMLDGKKVTSLESTLIEY